MLKEKEESDLVTVIRDMADSGFAPTVAQVISIATEYAEINEIKNPNFNQKISPSKRKSKSVIWRPTRRWLRRFMARHRLSRKRTKGSK